MLFTLLWVLLAWHPHPPRPCAGSTPALVRLELVAERRLPEAIVAGAIDEAATIWAPYGVAITARASPSGCPAEDVTVLSLALADDPAGIGRWASHLAAITFSPSGEPQPEIAVYYAAVQQSATRVTAFGADQSRWPQQLREQVIGRALGRAIAHEIGHFLLKSTAHSAAGLMRATHHDVDLTARERDPFALAPADLDRLRRLTARD